jgi:hypothetical protein
MSAASRWDMSNWKAGKVTLLQAAGINWAITYPKLSATLPTEISESQSPSTGQATGGAVNGTAPANASQTAWFTALLKSIGAPSTSANIQSLSDWYSHENSSWPPAASNNPFNSTLSAPGATTFNSVGVRNYATPTQGISATASTLNGYPGVIAALKSGSGLCGQGLASEFLKWSGGGYSSVC